MQVWKLPPLHPQTKIMIKKVNGNCYIELIHLLKILVSWLAKFCHLNLGELVLEKKIHEKSISKTYCIEVKIFIRILRGKQHKCMKKLWLTEFWKLMQKKVILNSPLINKSTNTYSSKELLLYRLNFHWSTKFISKFGSPFIFTPKLSSPNCLFYF